jgi:hypothetical protein
MAIVAADETTTFVPEVGSRSAPLRAYPGLDEHVRSADPKLVSVISDALRRSPTFDRLVTTLNSSDVVAYLDLSWKMPTGLQGYLAHKVLSTGGRRYIHIVLDATLDHDELIAIIAHELQHAVEVALASDVNSDKAIRKLFERLDSGEGRFGTTETSSAREIHDIVLRELHVPRSIRPSAANVGGQ